ncbi:MAG: hypothetical protein A3C08_02765 [Candidatus Taylorbacteria bacterium RIFCSPHIGHO2_02_FULL_47_18]|uniref:Uncharacterized protein n=1 Tax=Candidatus Taylorbacteria bacterium RIFCSPLOWO2_01_FULL_48_100 TaxID=1802322 RepID=A0A1G2NE22_9BACT|nr:MAG: hypothetical protein A2670_02475 [Candidatus Taylorbacteria bacterium RIFCSPHIGHO2_01_FULL_48_38]OHA27622.1 MAG: hypothetical protein A3C08_02765 [Candidatus Taylorbacteria bacterium RIFCSPHIGHO2_02_FULL_47_18]OHA34314.1 MAG: hypothetical protein A2938_02150 [Candidatus Taylorbacteria bacterium RIFCSPLOWO2_01_FULL_48_100]OHA40468.1 MAG: hypothetical protein A3J31_02785 [Candidatus Taylorbacteria bacterium RIFCSPLOWO2_02_FULL_48_16]OHA44892.1 MAG: hypothetical protein A3H13_03240 [Candid
MTETEFEAKTSDVELSEVEIYILRKDIGLPVGECPSRLAICGTDEMSHARLRSIQMRAWAKFGSKENEAKEKSRKKELNENPSVLKAVELVQEVGLNHSVVMGGSLILEGGISDPMKAIRVPAFRTAISDEHGFTSRPLAQANMLPARRALVAHVINKLKELGATLKKSHICHSDTVDEVYEFIFDGREVGLILMPH